MKTIKIRTKNNRTKKKIIQITKYSPYKIKCNNCNRQYIEGRSYFHKRTQNYESIETLITDFVKEVQINLVLLSIPIYRFE